MCRTGELHTQRRCILLHSCLIGFTSVARMLCLHLFILQCYCKPCMVLCALFGSQPWITSVISNFCLSSRTNCTPCVIQAAPGQPSSCAESPSSCCAEQLTEALHYWQAHSQALPVVADPTASADEPAGPTPHALSFRFADAALAITPTGQATVSPALLARLMLVAHHPIITRTRRMPQAAWTSLKRKIFKLGVLLDGRSWQQACTLGSFWCA